MGPLPRGRGSAVLALLIAMGAMGVSVEQPLGLILSPGGSKLVRLEAATPLAARAGDLLFAGDSLRTEAGAASFLFCPASAIETLGPSGEVRLEPKEPKVKSGKLSPQPARSCTLPTALRVTVASQQHYGVTMTRGGPDSCPDSAGPP